MSRTSNGIKRVSSSINFEADLLNDIKELARTERRSVASLTNEALAGLLASRGIRASKRGNSKGGSK